MKEFKFMVNNLMEDVFIKKFIFLKNMFVRKHQLCLFILMFFSSMPVYAQPNVQTTDTQLVQSTANRLADDYNKGGVNGIAEDIQACYAHFSSRATLKECLALDVGGLFTSYKLDGKEIEQLFPYMARDVVVQRVYSYAPKIFKTKQDFIDFAKKQGGAIMEASLSKIDKKN